MKWFLYALMALMIALLVIFGCNSDDGFGIRTGEDQRNELRGTNTLDESWDQAGIDHNRIMSYVGEWLQKYYNEKWTEEETKEQMMEAVLSFYKDSLGYDTTNGRLFLKEVVDFEYTLGRNSNMPKLIDDLVNDKLISEREENYLRRLVQFVYVDTLDSAVYADSISVFEEDVLKVSWKTEEILCLDFTAIAKHSWEFRKVGWDPDGDGIPISGVRWGPVGRADLGGAILGGLTGGAGGAGIGAAGSSAWEMWMQCWEDYW
ncbi:hypothetical protein KKC97_06805 [bacterium]|nr:hypothetical protein [bacterium]MBU1637358.1 hypothetical protein [bacterium]MBU1919616.1 hypothetical protein [bacterium]